MTLEQRIIEDYKKALINKHSIHKETLSYLIAQIKNKKIATQSEISSDDIISIIKKEIKSSNEASVFLKKAEKYDELNVELQKKALLESYIPTPYTEQQLRQLIIDIAKQHNISDITHSK
jgi:uncharacterized protein YqeY